MLCDRSHSYDKRALNALGIIEAFHGEHSAYGVWSESDSRDFCRWFIESFRICQALELCLLISPRNRLSSRHWAVDSQMIVRSTFWGLSWGPIRAWNPKASLWLSPRTRHGSNRCNLPLSGNAKRISSHQMSSQTHWWRTRRCWCLHDKPTPHHEQLRMVPP